jgi:hypothetical protein
VSKHAFERFSGSDDADEDVPVRVEATQVRDGGRKELSQIIDRLYRRRSLQRLSTWDQLRYTPEVADYLRRRSEVYRRLSGEAGTEGPLPFALGFFRITAGGALDPVADALPDPQPELIARLLSEFLEPGGRLIFGEGDAETRWIVEGEDELRVED